MSAVVRAFALALVLVLLVPLPTAQALPTGPPTVVRAVAVAQTSQGLVGAVANVSISQENGSGLLFIDTQPFTEVDMQGSARLAVRVAGTVTGLDVSRRDFFYVIRSDSQIIGGPSAGGVLTVGAIAALEGWAIDPHVFMTGTINPDGSIGPVGGIPEKAAAAADRGATLFLFPVGEEITQSEGASGRATVNLTEYCTTSLHIECRPVADVETAVTAFTGHVFQHPQPSSADTGARFAGVMLPLARRELDNATAHLAVARGRFANATGLPSSLAADLRSKLDDARLTLDDGNAAFQAQHYYTASSKAFVTSINARYVLSALDFVAGGEQAAFIDSAIADAASAVSAASARANASTITGLAQLEAVGAAESRITEAEQSLGEARAALTQGDAATALYQAAFTRERSATVGWWLDIGSAFATGRSLSAAEVAREASEAIDESAQVVTYAQTTLTNGGADASVVQPMFDELTSASADLARGFGAAALFEALEAQVRAGVVLTTSTGIPIPAARLSSAATEAQRAIDQARTSGVEPIAAASDFEFASDLTTDSDKLTYYDLAAIIARSGDFYTRGTGDSPVASSYIGTTPESAPAPGPALTVQSALSLTVLPFALGAVGAALLVLAFRRAPPLPAPEPVAIAEPPAPDTPRPMPTHPSAIDPPSVEPPRADDGSLREPPRGLQP
ncbi:MAG: S16 family serine protease [Thermoplasmatota archaeon]